MYVYVWKHQNGTPFYVGFSKSRRRTDPCASNRRGWLCAQTLAKLDPMEVIVELHSVASIEAGRALEQKLILQYGRIQLGTGTLTNLRVGGEGTESMSPEGRARLSALMRSNNPMHREDVRAKALARMKSPHVRKKFSGENNPAKRADVRQRLKDLWKDPTYRAARIAEKKGRAIHTEQDKKKRSEILRALPATHPMKTSHVRLNTDPDIQIKRSTALRSTEVRAKISAALKRKWAERKAK